MWEIKVFMSFIALFYRELLLTCWRRWSEDKTSTCQLFSKGDWQGLAPLDLQKMRFSYCPPIGGRLQFPFAWDKKAPSIILRSNSSTKSKVFVPKLSDWPCTKSTLSQLHSSPPTWTRDTKAKADAPGARRKHLNVQAADTVCPRKEDLAGLK